MKYFTRKLIQPTDLNSRGTLFGGQLLKWIDEEAAIFAICQLSRPEETHPPLIVTKLISEVNFLQPVFNGDIIEIGCELKEFGKTSITIGCVVRNKRTRDMIVKIENMVFVMVDSEGKPKVHGFSK